MEIFKIFAKGEALDSTYEHASGFQPNQENCPTVDGPYSDKKCCGNYPLRFPYKTLNGDMERDCCGEQVFNKLYRVCCADGTLGAIGDC